LVHRGDISSKLTTPNISFVAVVRGNRHSQSFQQQSQPRQEAPKKPEESVSEQANKRKQGLPVRATVSDGIMLENMFKVATVMQQIMNGLNDALSGQNKTVAIK